MITAEEEALKYLERAEKMLKLRGEARWRDPATLAQIAVLLKLSDICPNREWKDD